MDKELFDKLLNDYLQHVIIRTGCWGWDGYIGSGAQPKINVYYKGKQREYSIARFAFKIFLDIDDARSKNICMDRFCSNPDHRRDYILNNDSGRDRLNKDRARIGLDDYYSNVYLRPAR